MVIQVKEDEKKIPPEMIREDDAKDKAARQREVKTGSTKTVAEDALVEEEDDVEVLGEQDSNDAAYQWKLAKKMIEITMVQRTGKQVNAISEKRNEKSSSE